MNTTRAPLDDKAVRQAMAYAIDRQGIVDKAQMGGAIVASAGIMSPGTYLVRSGSAHLRLFARYGPGHAGRSRRVTL